MIVVRPSDRQAVGPLHKPQQYDALGQWKCDQCLTLHNDTAC